MNSTTRRLLLMVLGGVFLAGATALVWRRGTKHDELALKPGAGSRQVSGEQSTPSAPVNDSGNGLDRQLAVILANLRHKQEGKAAGASLTELGQALLAAPRAEASATIGQFLQSKADASTGQGFKPGARGSLAEAPTLRVFLLDYLGRIDPAAAAQFAHGILGSPDSADEWAVALRNLALGDTSVVGRVLLEQKVEALLRNEAWQQNPSAGYLEAFDLPVYLGGTSSLPALTELVRKQDNPAVAHAAYLVLDRLVIGDPARLLAVLAADPGLMAGRELTRANYFARADVRDAQQRQVLENYLLDPRLGAAELAQFAALYPNANYMISQNLLTSTPTPEGAALAGRDAESLRVVQDWLVDPRFASLQPQLLKVKQRLENFLRHAKGK